MHTMRHTTGLFMFSQASLVAPDCLGLPRIAWPRYRYMCELKRALDAKGNSVLEMPTGTGRKRQKILGNSGRCFRDASVNISDICASWYECTWYMRKRKSASKALTCHGPCTSLPPQVRALQPSYAMAVFHCHKSGHLWFYNSLGAVLFTFVSLFCGFLSSVSPWFGL